MPEDKRTARFVCVIAAVLPDGREFTTKGTIEGIIGYESRGEGGFGYDPIFFVPEFHCSTAELTMEQKNEVSHRDKLKKTYSLYGNSHTKNIPLVKAAQGNRAAILGAAKLAFDVLK